MCVGLFLILAGFAVEYVVFQVVPLVHFLYSLKGEDLKSVSVESWMCMPLTVFGALVPIIGFLTVGVISDPEYGSWSKRFSIVGVYLIITGLILL